jgi:hypothetical protein
MAGRVSDPLPGFPGTGFAGTTITIIIKARPGRDSLPSRSALLMAVARAFALATAAPIAAATLAAGGRGDQAVRPGAIAPLARPMQGWK